MILGVVLIMSRLMPQILKGKEPNEMVHTMIKVITGFILLAGVIATIGVIVWIKVRRGGGGTINRQLKKPEMDSVQTTVTCPKCGSPMVLRKGTWGEFWGCSMFPNCRGKRQVAKNY